MSKYFLQRDVASSPANNGQKIEDRTKLVQISYKKNF